MKNVLGDFLQVGGFLWVLRFPPTIKLCHDIAEILLKVALNTVSHNPDRPFGFLLPKIITKLLKLPISMPIYVYFELLKFSTVP
jgi:hypothetical protein